MRSSHGLSFFLPFRGRWGKRETRFQVVSIFFFERSLFFLVTPPLLKFVFSSYFCLILSGTVNASRPSTRLIMPPASCPGEPKGSQLRYSLIPEENFLRMENFLRIGKLSFKERNISGREIKRLTVVYTVRIYKTLKKRTTKFIT